MIHRRPWRMAVFAAPVLGLGLGLGLGLMLMPGGGGGADAFGSTKTDAAGAPAACRPWERVLGESGPPDYAFHVQPTPDGGAIAVGLTASAETGSLDVWLVRLDAQGDLVWSRTFGGEALEAGYSVLPTEDGGFLVAGETQSFGRGNGDAWLLKTDGDGHLQWKRTLGGDQRDLLTSVRPTADGGFILAGSTASFGAGGSDIWLVKTDAEGNELWSRTFGGSGRDFASSVEPLADGGFVLLGSTDSRGAGKLDLWLIRTDAAGNELWGQTFGGTEEEFNERENAVDVTQDGGFILIGYSSALGGGWLIRTDAEGFPRWERTLAAWSKPAQNLSQFWAVRAAPDGGFVVLGGDRGLIKTDEDGRLEWEIPLLGEVLFRLQDGRIAQALDAGTIPEELRAAFRDHGSPLSEEAAVTVVTAGAEWRITDQGRGFFLRREGETLTVFLADEGGTSVALTADGGFLVAGAKRDDFLVKKLCPPSEGEGR